MFAETGGLPVAATHPDSVKKAIGRKLRVEATERSAVKIAKVSSDEEGKAR